MHPLLTPGGRRAGPALAAPLLLALWLAPAPALARQPGTLQLGLSPAYAFVVLQDDLEPDGGGGSIFARYALSEAFALLASVLYPGHALQATEDDPGGTMRILAASAGLNFALDVLSLTPSIDAAVGVLHQQYKQERSTSMELQVGVGLDYELLPWLMVGAAFHYHAFLSNPSDYPVYFDIGPRVAFRLR